MKARASILSTIILLLLTACTSIGDKVDHEIDKQIQEVFSVGNSQLWTRVENQFFDQCKALGLFKKDNQRLEVFYDLMKFVQETGYPDEFYLPDDEKSRRLIQDLKQIGYTSADESAHRFLHKICKPIVDKYKYETKDAIYYYARIDPDSENISFNISAASIPVGFNRPNLNRPGLYKVLLLFYFSRMIGPHNG